jgi:uncharacterized lipoprotein YddW (UPF0748 family)
MKFNTIIFLCFFLCACSSNNDSTDNNNTGKDSTVTKDPTIVSKEKILWLDADANYSHFCRKENITYYLDRAKNVGFTKIVVDVRPVQGDALFKSSYLTEISQIGNQKFDTSWDYLQFFIDEAHKRDLKVTVSTTLFTGGSPSTQDGMVYRDSKWDGKTCIEYTKDKGLIDIKNDDSKVSAFLNPVLQSNQQFCLNFIKELVTKYDFDGYALDYCRYPDAESDFSDSTRVAFEKYIGAKLDKFPDDVFTWNSNGTKNPGKYYKQWWEFRSMVIHDFISKVKTTIKAIKPNMKLEYWAASWIGALYQQGQNWASTSYDFSQDYSWASANYKQSGIANLLDNFYCGTYLTDIYGLNDDESIEYGLARANRLIGSACNVYGSIYALNHQSNIKDAVYVCLTESKGLVVFDIIQVIELNEWSGIKAGIEKAETGK